MNVTAIIIIIVVVVVIIVLGIILNNGANNGASNNANNSANNGANNGTSNGASSTDNSANNGANNSANNGTNNGASNNASNNVNNSASSDSNTNNSANNGASSSDSVIIPPADTHIPEEVITYCPADGDWPQMIIGETVVLNCPSGMIGKRVRICREDGSWYDMSDCTEQSNEIIVPDNTDSTIVPDTQYCPAVIVNNPELTTGKVAISFNVNYRFYYKNCAADKINAKESEVIKNNIITGIYRFTLIVDVNKIPDEYKRIKTSIPSTVFNSIQNRVIEANNTNCKLTATDFDYDYPSELKVFKNEEYLIIISNTIYDIETYAYDYPYNYINNSIATIQSKHQQNIVPLNNELYKVWTSVADVASDAACKKSNLTPVWGSKIGDLYTNKYINLALVLNVLLRNTEVSLYSVNDCSAIFQYKRGAAINILMSQEKYCRGIYQLADVKSSFSNICGAVNTWNGKGWRYIIDFNADYQTTPNVYNIASGKTVYIFNDGNQLVKYDDVANLRKGVYVPTIECGLNMINE